MNTTTDYQKQAADFLADTGARMTARFVRYAPMPWDDDKGGRTASRDIFHVMLTRNGRRMRVTYGVSLNDTTGCGDNPPTAYDVLCALTKHDPGTHENFAGVMGYDLDSIKGLRTWKACTREYTRVVALFGDVLERLQEIN